MSKDGTRIGSLKQVVELRARIAELEAELAAERERREAVEKVLSWLDMRGGLGHEKHAEIDAHFARYARD